MFIDPLLFLLNLQEYKRLQSKLHLMYTYSCPEINCRKKFTLKGNLARHHKTAHVEVEVSMIIKMCKNYITDTKFCTTVFQFPPQKIQPSSISKQATLKSLVEKKFSCDLCDFKAFIKFFLQSHMDSKHKVEECICSICKKIFINRRRLEAHVNRTHREKKDKRKHNCIFCGTSYMSHSHLARHVKNAHYEDSIKSSTCSCDICGVKIYSKLQVEKHMILFHSKPFKCLDKKCFRSFSDENCRRTHHLKYHITKM